MAGVSNFVDLRIWKAARQWAKDVYQATQSEPFRSDRRLVEQINASAASVMANIAEGFGRGTQGEFVTFLGYSIGSLNETQSHLAAAFDRAHLSRDVYRRLFQAGTDLRKQIVAFLTSMVRSGTGVKNLKRAKSWTDEVWELYERVSGQQRPELYRSGQARPPKNDPIP
jgi:four helix bundle protein